MYAKAAEDERIRAEATKKHLKDGEERSKELYAKAAEDERLRAEATKKQLEDREERFKASCIARALLSVLLNTLLSRFKHETTQTLSVIILNHNK